MIWENHKKMFKFKAGGRYNMKKYPIPLQNAGKCKYCGCPVLFTPTLQIIGEDFKVISWRTLNSMGEKHHCFQYKIAKEEEKCSSSPNTPTEQGFPIKE